MKKIISLIFALVLLLSLAACGNKTRMQEFSDQTGIDLTNEKKEEEYESDRGIHGDGTSFYILEDISQETVDKIESSE
ncbi:lipoprotein, partial [Rhodovulum adriaticum]|uniref:lipoprotein n=1 Tax=Rhodovulum adriaticum TaxID=35804 RepID=UPI001903D55B